MPKGYQRLKEAAPLVQALREWRDKTASELFGAGNVDLYGGCLVLPSDILDRIVDCACIDKIRSVQDIVKETDWDEAHQHAEAILAIVHEYALSRSGLRNTASAGASLFVAPVLL